MNLLAIFGDGFANVWSSLSENAAMRLRRIVATCVAMAGICLAWAQEASATPVTFTFNIAGPIQLTYLQESHAIVCITFVSGGVIKVWRGSENQKTLLRELKTKDGADSIIVEASRNEQLWIETTGSSTGTYQIISP